MSKPLTCALVLNVALTLLLAAFPENVLRWIFGESGPVENIQCVLYLTGALGAYLYARKGIWQPGFHASAVLFLFALRELDFQKRFTGISITRTKFYFSPDISPFLKIICGLIVLAAAYITISFILRNYRAFFQGLRERKEWALSIRAGLVIIILAGFVDPAPRLFKAAGFIPAGDVKIIKTVLEESMELTIPLLFFLALLRYGKKGLPAEKS